MLNHLETPS